MKISKGQITTLVRQLNLSYFELQNTTVRRRVCKLIMERHETTEAAVIEVFNAVRDEMKP